MASIEVAKGRLVLPRTASPHTWMVASAAAHGALLCLLPSAPVIALGVWWSSNTISHNFIHRPFFRSRAANRLFGGYLSVLLGIPQSLWRDRHLAHHAGVQPRIRWTRELAAQFALIAALWAVIAAVAPRFLLWVYAPGYVAGLGLCALQGHYEHACGVTSHYGWLYNLLFFNDGYHAEHHSNPAASWTSLPLRRVTGASVSSWPAVLRWLDAVNLEALERLALRSPFLQARLLRSHARAIGRLAGDLPPTARIAIVGGGMFPRTALIMRKLMPQSEITIIDASLEHLEQARALLNGRATGVRFAHMRYLPSSQLACDLLVIPLAFAGDRASIYEWPPAAAVLVHDWIWRKRGSSRIVSLALLKRVNLVRR